MLISIKNRLLSKVKLIFDSPINCLIKSFDNPFKIVIFFNDVQFLKILLSNLILFEIITLVSFLQSANAEDYIFSRFIPVNSIFSKFLHSQKASSPMV